MATPRKRSRPGVMGYVDSTTCPTGKRAFTTREHAKTYRKQHTRLQDLRPYDCPDCEYWHLGHLPPAVIEGDMARAEVGHLARLKKRGQQ